MFWPGESHGLYSPRGHRELDTTERLSLSLLKGGLLYKILSEENIFKKLSLGRIQPLKVCALGFWIFSALEHSAGLCSAGEPWAFWLQADPCSPPDSLNDAPVLLWKPRWGGRSTQAFWHLQPLIVRGWNTDSSSKRKEALVLPQHCLLRDEWTVLSSTRMRPRLGRRQQLLEWLRPCWRDEPRNGALQLFSVWLWRLGGLVVRATDVFQRLEGEEVIRFHARTHHGSPAKKGHLNRVPRAGMHQGLQGGLQRWLSSEQNELFLRAGSLWV